jgi:hypothetical protein
MEMLPRISMRANPASATGEKRVIALRRRGLFLFCKGLPPRMDPITWLFVNVYDLFVSAAQLFIPVLVCALILTFIFNIIQKKTGWKWIGNAALTLIVSFTLFFLLLHASNILGGLSDLDATQIPPDIQNNPTFIQSNATPLSLLLKIIPQSILTGIVFALLVLPFAFIGVSIFDALKKRMKGFWVRFGITVFIGCLLFLLLILAFPWIPVSLLYLAFFGF